MSVVLFTHTHREGGELKEAGVTGENERLSDQKDRYVGAEIRTIQFSLSFGKVINLLCLQPPIMTKNGKNIVGDNNSDSESDSDSDSTINVL